MKKLLLMFVGSTKDCVVRDVRKSWGPPRFASLHWDSKLMMATHDSQERLVVAVGDNVNVKILGVPSHRPGTDQHSGDITTLAKVALLQSWNCTELIVDI